MANKIDNLSCGHCKHLCRTSAITKAEKLGQIQIVSVEFIGATACALKALRTVYVSRRKWTVFQWYRIQAPGSHSGKRTDEIILSQSARFTNG